MSIFRSEAMSSCQVFVPWEAAYNTVAALGEAGCVQFLDLNEDVNSFKRTFVGEVRRCDEIQQSIDYITTELKRDEMKITEDFANIPIAPTQREVADIEAEINRIETEIQEISRNQVNLQRNYLELIELHHVLEHAHEFFAAQEMETLGARKNLSTEERERNHLNFVAGVLRREKSFAFERMLWRISRGTIFVRRADIEEPLKDPVTGENVYKTVFIVFYQGEQLNSRIKKICSGFRANIYACPGMQKEREEMLVGLRVRIEDIKQVLQQAQDHRSTVLFAVSKKIWFWEVKLKKMKAIYMTLNCFRRDVTQNTLVGEVWTPKADLPKVQEILTTSSIEVGSPFPAFVNVVDTNMKPPTYFRSNKFTRAYQALIDAYGVADYGEVNPALTSCITFPFLFSVMFGDVGHGLIMFLFGLFMVIKEKSLALVRNGGEIWNIMFAARYVITFLGLFAMYSGLLYNEVFSISVNIFGSRWKTNYNASTVISNVNGLTLDPVTDESGVYPFGMDPVWNLASNNIIFTNSLKMKMSIIMGIIHMTMGLSMAVVNFTYFKKYALIFLEFLPELLFLWCLFGYLAFMMFFKWFTYTPHTTELPLTPGCAPSLLIMFINMMLLNNNDPLPGCDANLFSFQIPLERGLLVVAVICIPWLLLGKPLYIQFTRKARPQTQPSTFEISEMEITRNKVDIEITMESNIESFQSSGKKHEEEEEESMGDIWVHQAIHAVEFILSCVSHTASYLRLWALSLAHSELSQVLWQMILQKSLTFNLGYVGCIAIFLIFAVWAVLTIAIMVMMEGLSAFLHTLRLHWVEFMSKFYGGEGYPFEPFSFKSVFDAEDD